MKHAVSSGPSFALLASDVDGSQVFPRLTPILIPSNFKMDTNLSWSAEDELQYCSKEYRHPRRRKLKTVWRNPQHPQNFPILFPGYWNSCLRRILLLVLESKNARVKWFFPLFLVQFRYYLKAGYYEVSHYKNNEILVCSCFE